MADNNINEIENELLQLLAADRQHWVKIYRLMDTVEREHAYTTSSYTQWVNQLADKAKVHVSLLWARKKAGYAYEQYAIRASKRGITVPELGDQQVSLSPDNINLAIKIAGNNDKVADELIDKIVAGELHRTDLKRVWDETKKERVAKGQNPYRKSRHDEGKDLSAESCAVTAGAILYAIQHNSEWVIDNEHQTMCVSEVREHREKQAPCYKVLPELAVRPGTSHNARRIDAAVFEDLNKSVHDFDVDIHGIEIKVDKNDLLGDHKMAEYTSYVDYFWIAIPEDLISFAEECAMPTWGILVFRNGIIHVQRRAARLEAIMRSDTLVEAVKRL